MRLSGRGCAVKMGETGLKFLRQIGARALAGRVFPQQGAWRLGVLSAMVVLSPSAAHAAVDGAWVLPHEIVDHPAFLPALVAVLFAATLFAYHLFRLRRINITLRSLAEERMAAVNSLQETEARFLASERIARIGHWERHFDSGAIHWSEQTYAIFGLDPATHSPTLEDAYNRIHPDDREQVRAAAWHAHERGGHYDVEHRVVLPDGESRWVHVQSEVILDEGDKPRLFRGAIQDIHEFRETRNALRQSEEWFRSLFDASGTGIMVSDREGRYVRVNPAFCAFVGYDAEELFTLKFDRLLHADDMSIGREAYQRLFSGETKTHTRERRYVRKDGVAVWAIVTAVVATNPHDGDMYLITNIQDITERKAAEQALADNQARLLRAQRIADIGDWERDIVAGTSNWSEQTRRILGIAEDVLGGELFEHFLSVIHPEDREAFIEGHQRSLEDGTHFGREFRIKRADTGEVRYLRTEAQHFQDQSGRSVSVAGTIQDITELKTAELARLESEARFRSVFNAGAAGIVVTSKTKYAVEVNKAFEEFVGYSEDEILNMRPLELVHPDDRAAAEADRHVLEATPGHRIYAERRFIHRDGTVLWGNVAISRLESANDDGLSIIAVQDITDRKRADEALARKTKLLDLVREIALAANHATDFEEVIRYCLDRVCVFTGWQVGHAYLLIKEAGEDQLEYLPVWYLSDLDRYAPVVEASKQIQVRRGLHLAGEVLETKAVVWRENIPRRKTGNELRGRAIREVGLKSGFGGPVMAGDDVVAVIEFFSDQTTPRDAELVDVIQQIGTEIGRVFERNRAAARLKRSEQNLRQIIDNAPIWIYVKDIEGRYLIANSSIASIYNMTPEELIGRRQEDIYPYPEITARIKETDRDVILHGQTNVYPEWRIYMHDGEERCMRLVKMPFTMSDGTIGVLGVAVDITEEKRAEEELWRGQRMDALGQMTGGVAHDFNNLLTIILGNLQLLKRRLEDPALLKLAGSAERAARRGGDVTGRLLAFARSQPLAPQAVDVNALIGDMLPLIEQTVGHGIDIDCQYDGAVQSVLADPAQIESALINLAANARDAMPGGGHLTISARNAEVRRRSTRQQPALAPGDYVVISVADDGTGMDRDVAARALEPFFTTKDVGKGSGLGLPSVYGFAEQSGGGVRIDSERGQGTRVSLYLPQCGEDAVVVPLGSSIAAVGGNEAVLLVEDDPDVRDYARIVLGELNYRVIEAGDGEEALSILQGPQEIDLLFTDVILPGRMDGRAVAREALKCRPDLKVIMTSGNWDLASPNGLPFLEGAAVLPKPYTEENLADIIRSVLGKPLSLPERQPVES